MSNWKDRFKIFVVGGDIGYTNWMPGDLVSNLEDADVVVFTGGEDVTPMYYGKTANIRTRYNINRDTEEKLIFDKAQALGKHCVGICRGSQFLCVMSGGELIQHQDNPLFIHNIKTYDNYNIPITSTHHQAQYPYNLSKDSYKILAWTKGISTYHQGESTIDLPLPDEKECEIVFYKDTKCLAIQGHPELMSRDSKYDKTINYLQYMFKKFANDIYNLVEEQENMKQMNYL